MIGNIIDAIPLQNAEFVNTIMFNCILAVCVLLQNIPTHMLFINLISSTLRSVETRLRMAIIIRLQRLAMSFHMKHSAGSLQTKILRDVEQVQRMSSQMVQSLLPVLLNVIVAASIIFYKEPLVAGLFLLILPVSAIVIRIFRTSMRKRNTQFRKEIEKMNASVTEMLEMVPITRAHSVEDFEIDRIGTNVENVRVKGKRLDLINALFGSLSFVIFHLFQIIILVITAVMAFNGTISIGDVVIFNSFFMQILSSINSVLNVYPEFAKGFESVKSIGEIMTNPDIENNIGKKVVTRINGSFIFENITFSYPKANIHAINNFNLSVRSGETIAIIGESGSGKSTLMSLIMGFIKPQQGRILIDRQPMEYNLCLKKKLKRL